MIVKFLLAVFIFGGEATQPPEILSPHDTIESCNRAKAGVAAQIAAAGAKDQVYPACLQIMQGTPI